MARAYHFSIVSLGVLASIVFQRSSTRSAFDPKIVRGHVVEKPLPFYVAIMDPPEKREKPGQQLLFCCGSSLFHPKFAITACHIGVYLYSEKTIQTLRPGLYKHQRRDPTYSYGIAGTLSIASYDENYQIRRTNNYYPHPKCALWISIELSRSILIYDVGIYEFIHPFMLSATVNLIPNYDATPLTYFDLEDYIENKTTPATCHSYGFGTTETGTNKGYIIIYAQKTIAQVKAFQQVASSRTFVTVELYRDFSEVLKEGEVFLLERYVCQENYCSYIYPFHATHWNNCLAEANSYYTMGQRCGKFRTHNASEYRNIHDGDSGGPLVCYLAKNNTAFIGVLTGSYNEYHIRQNEFYYAPYSVAIEFIKKFLAIHTSKGVLIGGALLFPLITATAAWNLMFTIQ